MLVVDALALRLIKEHLAQKDLRLDLLPYEVHNVELTHDFALARGQKPLLAPIAALAQTAKPACPMDGHQLTIGEWTYFLRSGGAVLFLVKKLCTQLVKETAWADKDHQGGGQELQCVYQTTHVTQKVKRIVD